ncbi:hypothetical protein SAMN05192550_1483 [Flavobacterium glycines]|uniref:Uncharacterized protein n=1 Tax=Flavobacterium glycines TaxID=551990 RepID=A0A1B9DWN9_9FLAO|nr:hypothetical protein [Flavobacterium glycines]OCB74099.1 hypothetical protein FBGL_02830 [Flavobacterium glycines]GEL09516.1 hypothetical protein FGL01_02550 [Flavobacterium glycines]SDJ03963.1 hypothetical protein SAMN05192550_1483 [Flavobacterium glycines]
MENYLRQLVSIEFLDKKEVYTGFLIDYSDDWILLKNNPVDFIIDGFVILKNKNIERIYRDEEHEFTEKVIRLKGLKTNAKDIIPIKDLASIISFVDKKYGVFQIAKKSATSAYLGKLIQLNDQELIIDFLDTKGQFGGELSFNPEKIRVIEFDTDYINSLKLVTQENQNKH